MNPHPARTTELEALPLFGRALVAVRMARRAAMAMLEPSELATAGAACDAMERIARDGDGWSESLPELAATARLVRTRGTVAALEAVRWAYDSLGAAQGASDFPVDSVVAASARRCLDAISADSRVSRVQVGIVLAADIDQISFACSEAGVGTYAGVTAHVLGRLAPCHALALNDGRPSMEEEAR